MNYIRLSRPLLLLNLWPYFENDYLNILELSYAQAEADFLPSLFVELKSSKAFSPFFCFSNAYTANWHPKDIDLFKLNFNV